MKKNLIIALAFSLNAVAAFGWGQKGHDSTAFVAECNLTPAAKAAAEQLLDGKSIVYWSNWLDNASHTPEYAFTKTWHYKNIDQDIAYEDAPTLETGNVVTALTALIPVLSDESVGKDEKALALKIVVHLMGDLHQPMHMGHASDLGGNRWTVKYFGKNANLHGIWDSNLIESAHKWSYTEWQQNIDRISGKEKDVISMGSLDDWGKETFELATNIYATTPEGTDISYDYIADWTPAIEDRVLKGGVRLAYILNKAFDPSFTSFETIEAQ